MELYVARQPVFNKHSAIVGYELLHRESGKKNEFTTEDGEYASSSVITGTFLTLGLNVLTEDKLAFVNFTSELITSGVAMLLPKEQLVVEVLESVPPTREIIRACEQLKSNGYRLALDDYVLSPVFEPLARLADIIKVDFRQSSEGEQYRTIMHYRDYNIQFLAEKVETEAEFNRAVSMGYSLFQGYFFAKPVILSASTIPVSKLGYIQLMQAVNEAQPDFRLITAAIESDVTLALETIKLSNSAYYGRRLRISSIRQAVVTLGLEGVRRWIYLAAMRRLGAGKPDILVTTSIIRSRFLEMIAQAAGQQKNSPEYTLLGLFSMLDALTGCSFDRLLANLDIAEEIKDTLMGLNPDSHTSLAYRAMLLYERGDWEGAEEISMQLGLAMDTVASAYIQSLKWYNDYLKMTS